MEIIEFLRNGFFLNETNCTVEFINVQKKIFNCLQNMKNAERIQFLSENHYPKQKVDSKTFTKATKLDFISQAWSISCAFKYKIAGIKTKNTVNKN